eukprot:PITA_33113
MVAGTATTDDVCEVEASRLWKAMVKDAHNLFPKVFPEIFSSVIFLQGDGGVGTIKQINFTSDNDFSYVKEQVDEMDDDKMVYKYTLIEGGFLEKELSALNAELKLIPKNEGACVVSWISNYETLPGTELNEGRVEEIKENSNAMLRKIERYLLSNPNLYC